MDSPIDAMIVVEEHAGELTGGVEVGPVDWGPAGPRRDEDVGLERCVERREEREIWRLLWVLVSRVDRWRIQAPPFLVHHLFAMFDELSEMKKIRRRKKNGTKETLFFVGIECLDVNYDTQPPTARPF